MASQRVRIDLSKYFSLYIAEHTAMTPEALKVSAPAPQIFRLLEIDQVSAWLVYPASDENMYRIKCTVNPTATVQATNEACNTAQDFGAHGTWLCQRRLEIQ
jgi:hypothetical protein